MMSYEHTTTMDSERDALNQTEVANNTFREKNYRQFDAQERALLESY